MKAITIHQPWASLIACGAKQIETRSWATKYRGPIAIHAGLKDPKKLPLLGMEAFESAAKEALEKAGLEWCFLPTGSIIATADLVDCVRVDGCVNGEIGPFAIPVFKAELENGETVRGNEFLFGDYSIGRYAWILDNIRQIDPVPARGMQRLWEWEASIR
ncbi:ASCH domain-containing protein [Sporomusa paucivorans]|uniref:ASCH domain-containing protein n=1 Tax=Sporomusa paucivorans TaxID=2376 RepID=UPI003570E15C